MKGGAAENTDKQLIKKSCTKPPSQRTVNHTYHHTERILFRVHLSGFNHIREV